jgi:hypothetical protein
MDIRNHKVNQHYYAQREQRAGYSTIDKLELSIVFDDPVADFVQFSTEL